MYQRLFRYIESNDMERWEGRRIVLLFVVVAVAAEIAID